MLHSKFEAINLFTMHHILVYSKKFAVRTILKCNFLFFFFNKCDILKLSTIDSDYKRRLVLSLVLTYGKCSFVITGIFP